MPHNFVLDTSEDKLSLGNAQLPFIEQIKFFLGKEALKLPTEHWDDINGAEHDQAFIVAGAQKAEILTDFYDAVAECVKEGQSLDWFRKNFDAIVERHGWQYNGSADWRARTIYVTNLSTSYAAGRDEQLADPDLRLALPYLEYNLGNSMHHRPDHAAWSGLTLPHDDLFWADHRPVKAWGCNCWLSAVPNPTSGKDTPPKVGTYKHIDRWGEIHTLPVGVDYGWDRSNNQQWTPDYRKYPKPIADDLKADVNV